MLKRALPFVFATIMLFGCEKDNHIATKVENPKISHSWMYDLIKKYPDKDIKISDLAMPGSHDAGMYVLTKCSFGANACNTQTQQLNFTKQLEAGFRVFDVRPSLLNGKYITHHTSECGGLGCQGEYMEKILQMTRDFLETNPEIVIFQLSHYCNMSASDAAFLEQINNILGDRIYKETERIEHISEWPLKKILGENADKGKVILVFDGGMENNNENRQKGYFSQNVFKTVGGWSNKFNYWELKEDQLRKYNDYTPQSNLMFEFSWQMTQDAALAVSCALGDNKKSILNMSKQSNPDFQIVMDSLIQVGAINANKHPNIFWLDYGDTWMKDYAIKISEIGIQ